MTEVSIDVTHDPLEISVSVEHPLPEVALAVAADLSAAVAKAVKNAKELADVTGEA